MGGGLPTAGALGTVAAPMTDETAAADKVPAGFDVVPVLAHQLKLSASAVAAVVALLDEGNTVPFIARYRKERTGGLDEVQIRAIEERREYVVELETRRAAILASVSEQGKLTSELGDQLRAAETKSELEDLYAPFRPRRKTRASVARDKGLEPLAQRILAQGAEGDPAAEAAAFVKEGIASADEALAGARDIAAETVADTAAVRALVRQEYGEHGGFVSERVPGKTDEPTKFEQYYAFGESVKTIPSHRFLAIRRGEAEGVLRAHVQVDAAKVVAGIERQIGWSGGSPWAEQLRLAIADALKRLLAPSVENDVRAELKLRSDHQAVDIFAGNLRNLLLAAPLGSASVIGVDPGLRTGCKCAAIDATGRFLGTVTIYITQGDAQLAKAKADFADFVTRFTPSAIAVGNGTGGREAEAFVKQVLADMRPSATARDAEPGDAANATTGATTDGTAAGQPGASEASSAAGGEAGAGAATTPGADGQARGGATPAAAPAPFVVQVNEAGASVYSASDLAREEFPELDLTIRGAISIARRLQDPLAELVKVEPKSIGVGQYQHDVHQPLLGKKLGEVVESAVNHVGVELNTASAQLLGYVAGIGKALAKKIVLHRDASGAFQSRAQLMEVAGLGPKAYEQAAGFLRIAGSAHPLDRSAVHPERYALVETMASDVGVGVPDLVGNQQLVDRIDLSKYVTADVGELTLRDIAAELRKPGRDPRAEFAPPAFRADVTSMEDLKPGMVLEGIVTNVTAFGAFVDIGVHNDGLVHVSQLSDNFIKDPAEVVKVGQKLTVRVLEVDKERKRIALSVKKPASERRREQGGGRLEGERPRGGRGRGQGQQQGARGGAGQGGAGQPQSGRGAFGQGGGEGQSPGGRGAYGQGGGGNGGGQNQDGRGAYGQGGGGDGQNQSGRGAYGQGGGEGQSQVGGGGQGQGGPEQGFGVEGGGRGGRGRGGRGRGRGQGGGQDQQGTAQGPGTGQQGPGTGQQDLTTGASGPDAGATAEGATSTGGGGVEGASQRGGGNRETRQWQGRGNAPRAEGTAPGPDAAASGEGSSPNSPASAPGEAAGGAEHRANADGRPRGPRGGRGTGSQTRGGQGGGRGGNQGGGSHQGGGQGGSYQGGGQGGNYQGGGQGGNYQGGNQGGGNYQGGNQGGGSYQGGGQGGGQGGNYQGGGQGRGPRGQGGGNYQGGGRAGGQGSGQAGGNYQGGGQGGGNYQGGGQAGGNYQGGGQGGGSYQGGGQGGGNYQGGGQGAGQGRAPRSGQGGGSYQGGGQGAGSYQGGGNQGGASDPAGGQGERGPRRDERGAGAAVKPEENWGVAGFKNSPFAALVTKTDKPKR